MPQIVIEQTDLIIFGNAWTKNRGRLDRHPPLASSNLGNLFDKAVGKALAVMLGNIPIVTPKSTALTPAEPDCVEVGPVRVIGGVRPQNFDVGYRPDGIRFAYDTKTLNDNDSVGRT